MEDITMNSTLGNETLDAKKPGPTCQGITGYEIQVKDHLETYWHKWFEGWSITNLENGEFLLKGMDVDQSKLHGALNKIRDLNLTLIGVRCIPVDQSPFG